MLEVKSLFNLNDKIYRVLANEDGIILAQLCSPTPPTPEIFNVDDLKDAFAVSEEKMWEQTGLAPRGQLTVKEAAVAQERFTEISPILPYVFNAMQRKSAITSAANISGKCKRTIRRLLYLYLAYNDKNILAPREAKVKELTEDEKNFRWALNKFYYIRNGKSLKETYLMMIREKYCDVNGNVLEHPSEHQFRYFHGNHKRLQTEYISRGGIKDYQMNHRPLLGENVQQFAPCVGTGMLDATVCDIYLCDIQGNVVGRPVLTLCVDAYSCLCCGYSLTWEGGMYSLRNLFLNLISDKVELCHQHGISIEPKDWPCMQVPAVLVTDRGSEYASSNFEQLAELGCKIINLPAFRPELKAPVEKMFDLLQNSFKPYLKGRGVIDVDFKKRGAHDYRMDACLTLKDFEKIVLHTIIFHNTQRIQKSFPYTRDMLDEKVPPHAAEIWNYDVQKGFANLITVSKELLMAVLLPRTKGKFTRRGLIVNRLRYHAEGYTEKYLAGGDVVVAYNPEDVSIVYMVEDNYKEFGLIESRYLDMTLEEVSAFNEDHRQLLNSYKEENLQGRVNLISHIITIASEKQPKVVANLKDIRTTREAETLAIHKDFIKEAKHG